jgi:hypothetical protein
MYLDWAKWISTWIDLGLHNFGAHLGFRYFFTEGFGIFYRSWNSIASYKILSVLTN